MNYTLQLHSNNRTYPVPRGLHDLMADIAREVLRNQPNNIEKFIFNYIDALMKIRRVAKGGVQEVDKTVEEGAEITLNLNELGLTPEEADEAASKIQAAVRGYLARKEVKEIEKQTEEKRVSRLDVSHMTSEILNKYKLTMTQADNICTVIQAFFRGWLVRKKKISNIPSHESWRHDWLSKEFQMSPEEVQAATHTAKKAPEKEESLLFQPRRSIEIDHIKFMKSFKGELADYDDKTESSSIDDLSDEEIEEGSSHKEQKGATVDKEVTSDNEDTRVSGITKEIIYEFSDYTEIFTEITDESKTGLEVLQYSDDEENAADREEKGSLPKDEKSSHSAKSEAGGSEADEQSLGHPGGSEKFVGEDKSSTSARSDANKGQDKSSATIKSDIKSQDRSRASVKSDTKGQDKSSTTVKSEAKSLHGGSEKLENEDKSSATMKSDTKGQDKSSTTVRSEAKTEEKLFFEVYDEQSGYESSGFAISNIENEDEEAISEVASEVEE